MSEGYYKIKPEIRDFILKEAGECPQLGCRKLSGLIRNKFGLEVSKSSISAILKEEGLNKPVGRRAMVGLPIAQAVGRRPSGEKSIGEAGRGKKSSPYQGEAGRGLIVEEKPLLARIEREISLAPRIIQNDKFPPVVQEECRQIVNKITDSPSTSLRAGRAQDTEKGSPVSVPGLGCWFLKASELCLGGLQAFSALLSSNLKEEAGELLAKNEALLYLPVLGKKSSPYQGEAGRGIEEITDINGSWGETLAAITGRRYSNKDVQAYLESLKQVGPANLELFAQEGLEQKEVLGLKFILEDGASFFLDGATRSIWSKNHIPLEFSQGLSKAREYLVSAIIQDSSPLIGQAAPDFEVPTPAFLNFIAACSGQNSAQAIKKIEFYDDEDKLIEALEPIPLKRHYFILGIWPWQYPDRSIFEKESLRLIGGSTTFTTGYPKDTKEILAILTNLPENEWNDQRVISLYLERWPNLEAGYQDFLDRIGHYFEVKKTNSPQKDNPILPTPTRQGEVRNPPLNKGRRGGVNQILDFWQIRLSSFCQRHFFPLKYAGADFSRLQECFFSLPGVVKTEEKTTEIIFCRPQEASHCEDLAYACQRVNEADVWLRDGRKLKLLFKR